MTPAGIVPATFRFVTLHLNHCATAVPINISRLVFIMVQILHLNFPTHCPFSVELIFRFSVSSKTK